MNAVLDLSAFQNLRLRGNFKIIHLELTDETIADAIGRQAVARTRIVGRDFDLRIRAGLSEHELSVTLYHEILEAALVGSDNPPESLADFNEGDFERSGYQMHERLGVASAKSLNQMLQQFGFSEK